MTTNKKIDILCITFFLISLLYYFVTPFTEDIFVFLGAAHIAEIQYGGGIWGAIHSWEIKPFINRILIFVVYKFTSLFVDFDAKQDFIIVLKLVYSIFIFASAYCLSAILRKMEFHTLGTTFRNYFLLLCCILFLHPFTAILEAEYSALLFSFFALYFLLSPKRVYYAIGVLILSIIPFFKGISAIFVIQILCILFGLFQWNWRQILKTGFLLVAVCLFIISCLYFMYPQEFVDIKDATLFQSSFEISISGFTKLVFLTGLRYTIYQATQFPLLPITVFAVLFIILKDWTRCIFDKEIISLFFAWVVGYFAIIIQHHFFVYHFVNLSIPMVFSIFLVIKLSKEYLLFKKATIIFTGLFFLLFLLGTSPLQRLLPEESIVTRYPGEGDYLYMQKTYGDYDKIIKAKPKNLDINSEVLYLDDGRGVWCWGAKSASRYFFPLPVQRYSWNKKLAKRKCYKDVLDVMNAFDGKYILFYESWFKVPELEDFNIFRKKLKEYDRILITDGYAIYEKIKN